MLDNWSYKIKNRIYRYKLCRWTILACQLLFPGAEFSGMQSRTGKSFFCAFLRSRKQIFANRKRDRMTVSCMLLTSLVYTPRARLYIHPLLAQSLNWSVRFLPEAEVVNNHQCFFNGEKVTITSQIKRCSLRVYWRRAQPLSRFIWLLLTCEPFFNAAIMHW